MDSNSSKKITFTLFSSFPLMSIAFLMLLGAKIFCNYQISWWWVVSPFWIPWAIAFAIFFGLWGISIVGGLVVALVAAIVNGIIILWNKVVHPKRKEIDY